LFRRGVSIACDRIRPVVEAWPDSGNCCPDPASGCLK